MSDSPLYFIDTTGSSATKRPSATAYLPEPASKRPRLSDNLQTSAVISNSPTRHAPTNVYSATSPGQTMEERMELIIAQWKSSIDLRSKKFWAVLVGKKPGIYTSWDGPNGAQAQTKGFSRRELGNAPADVLTALKTSRAKSLQYLENDFIRENLPSVLARQDEIDAREVQRLNNRMTTRVNVPAPRTAVHTPTVETSAASSLTSSDGESSGSRSSDRSPVETPMTEGESSAEDYIPLSSEPEAPTDPVLCKEQQDAVDLAVKGHNVFITGSGGCGKSVCVKALRDRLRAMGKNVHTIAPTGLAALQVDGRTTWNYAGWQPEDSRKDLQVLELKMHGRNIWKRLAGTDVLIIDEISMIENNFFTRLSWLLSAVRRKDSKPETWGPFGGAQVIAVGDFCQLPPVLPFQNCAGHGSHAKDDKWAYKSVEWERCEFRYVHLVEIHRQSDQALIGVLQTCRLGGELTPKDIDLLTRGQRKVEGGVRLFAKRDEVKEHNDEQLAKLPSRGEEFWCLDVFDCHDDDLRDLEMLIPDQNRGPRRREHQPLRKLQDHRFDMRLTLKVGMPVILLVNLDLEGGLCNGSQGIIVDFKPISETQVPQSPDFKSYKKDPDPEAAYERALARWQQVRDYMTAAETRDMMLPEVLFHDDSSPRLIIPHCSLSEMGNKPYSRLMRTQIPLAPGWAMTIHKSQGLSLEKVVVNLSNVYEKGQAYVALSRARNLEGLKIEGTVNVLRSKLQLDEQVRMFLMDHFPGVMKTYAPSSRGCMCWLGDAASRQDSVRRSGS
ncbi:Uu.00g051840.m01.CDS01 [Anthostomella pinea]|uniref:ATP-dependent DNA helicase n=1 Tax=Anthostomella pinea TaxID=933095 RepID=A0AAI8YP95_9PEZI|nr:Uu.00g051840.m01.CDS01 [Anthostomella pinea]